MRSEICFGTINQIAKCQDPNRIWANKFLVGKTTTLTAFTMLAFKLLFLKGVEESRDSEIEQDFEKMEIRKDSISEKLSDTMANIIDSVPMETNDVEDVLMQTSALESSAIDTSVVSEADNNGNQCKYM